MVPALTVPSRVPQAIFGLASHLSLDSAIAATNVLEAGFYGSLKGGMLETGRLVNWIRETSIARIHAIQVIFNLANVGLVLYGTIRLVNEAVERFPFSQVTVGGNSPLIKGASVLVALVGTVTLGVLGLNRFSPALAPLRKEEGVEISETLSTQQKIAKLLHMSKLILNVGLACLVKNRFWFAISLAGSGYSLLKNMQLKWINFASTTHNPGPGEIRAAQATYKMLALPPVGAATKDECPICMDNPPDIAFCAKHVFCQICVSQLVKDKSPTFLNGLQLTKDATRHYHNHVYSHTSYSYRAVIPQESLPTCSFCRDIPLHNGLDIQVMERYNNTFNASVTITRPPVDRQYLYDNLYPIYNAAQAGLSLLQTYPELAGTIFKIQKLMLVTDLIGFAFTTYYAYNKAAEKLKLQDSKIAKVAAVAIVITTAALSYAAVLKLNAFLKSAIVLKELLEQLPIPPEALRRITVEWHSPFSRTLMQCLYINRIVASLALAYFSKDRKKSLFNAAAQLTSLVGVSKLKWIAFTQTFERPLQKVVAEGGALHGMFTDTVERLTLRTYSLANLSKDLKSTLQSIYSASNAFFQKSTWERYWWVTYNHGYETGRKLIYRVTLQKNSLEEFSKNRFLQGLTGYDITATDAISYYPPHVHAQ